MMGCGAAGMWAGTHVSQIWMSDYDPGLHISTIVVRRRDVCGRGGDVVPSVQMWTCERNGSHNNSVIVGMSLCDLLLNFAASLFIYSLFSWQGVHAASSRAPYATVSAPPLWICRNTERWGSATSSVAVVSWPPLHWDESLWARCCENILKNNQLGGGFYFTSSSHSSCEI